MVRSFYSVSEDREEAAQVATYCRRERRNFPDSQFEVRPPWGLCHVHEVENPHTVGGTTIEGDPDVPVPEIDVVELPPAAPREGW